VTQVTDGGKPASGVALSNELRREGWCRRGVGTSPPVCLGSCCSAETMFNFCK